MMGKEVIHVMVDQADKTGFPEFAITVLITVLSGVLIFALSEWLKELWLTPLQEYKKLRAKVSYVLTVYASYYSNPVDIAETNNKLPDNYENAAKELRKAAAELRAFIETLSWIRYGIPARSSLYEASANLIGISNGLQTPYNSKKYSEMADMNYRHREVIYQKMNLYREVTTQ